MAILNVVEYTQTVEKSRVIHRHNRLKLSIIVLSTPILTDIYPNRILIVRKHTTNHNFWFWLTPKARKQKL